MSLPRIRQLVLLVPDLEPALAELRALFGFQPGLRDVDEMAKLGFAHEICSFEDTFLEVCTPLAPEWSHARLVEKRGAFGYMVDVQVADLAGVVDRAKALGIDPLFTQDFHGSRISQWHPKALGTLAEFDEISPAETWHYAPEIFDHPPKGPATDLVGAEVAVPDPTAMARTWAAVLDIAVGPENTLALGGSSLRFVEGTEGFRSVDVAATDAGRVGDVVRAAGMEFRFVEARRAERSVA